MKATFYLFTFLLLFSTNLFSQNTNKRGTNPKLNAAINNPALMGLFYATQVSGNYTMGYQPVNVGVTQQHTSNIDFNSRIQNSRTTIGGGARFEKTYSNDFEDAVLSYGAWLSLGYKWDFDNQTHFGVGLTIGHQYNEIQYFEAGYPGYQSAVNFFKTKKETSESLISNLGFSYYGEDFFISLSNTGLSGMYDIYFASRSSLSPFGGLARLNYYDNQTFSYYIGLEFKPATPVNIGITWSNSFYGQDLKSINVYAGYTYAKVNLAYSVSNNKIYFEDFGVYHDRAWVHSFTLSYLM